MIKVGFTLLALLPQADQRIDFSLHSSTILIAVAFLVLVNLLLAAALYPYFKGGDSTEPSTEDTSDQGELVDGQTSDDGGALDEKVDDFLEEIQAGKRQ